MLASFSNIPQSPGVQYEADKKLASFSSSPQSPGVQYEADKKLASKLAPTGSVTLITSHCGSWLASDKDNPATRYSGKNKKPRR